MQKSGVKELRETFYKKFNDVDSALEEIEDIEAVHKNIKKLDSSQLESFITLSKESITAIKNNIEELSIIIKATKLYIKDVNNLVKKIG